MAGKLVVEEAGRLDYDGSQIEPLWAYRALGVQGDSIVYFQGGMRVSRERLVDAGELRESEIAVPISAKDALHIIVEHFDDPGLRLAYHRQRLLVNAAKERIIDATGVHVKRKASDLYVGDRKLSVSVATASASSSKIHLGINVSSEGAPRGVRIVGLAEMGVEDALDLGRKISMSYAEEIEGIEEDICKTRVF